MRTEEQLGWYRHLDNHTTIAGSLFTLLHLPFMAAFGSLVLLGTLPLSNIDPVILILSLAAVAMTLYGEHMLDDTSLVGKPWGTVFPDRVLIGISIALFVGALVTGIMALSYLGSAIPLVGVVIGVMFSVLYGLEVWSFHAVVFGAAGMGGIPVFSYLAQSVALQNPIDAVGVIVLFVSGTLYGYAMLGAYERTKVDTRYWTPLGVIFLIGYAVALLALLRLWS